jgi:hypothetical protein
MSSESTVRRPISDANLKTFLKLGGRKGAKKDFQKVLTKAVKNLNNKIDNK